METRYSLCISYPNYKDTSKYITFRIADLYQNQFVKAVYPTQYESQKIEDYHPKHIGFKHHEVSSIGVQVREWWIDSYPRTASKIDNTPFYEVIFLEELDLCIINDSKVIQDILNKGFVMSEGISDNLLLVIGSTEDEYIVLECSKRNFQNINHIYKLPANTADMIHTQHYFKMNLIKKSDVLDTADVNISISFTEKAKTRFFYCFTYLPPTKEKFYLRDISEYIPLFLNRYIKQQKAVLSYSNGEIKSILNLIHGALTDQIAIKEFFSVTGYSFDHIIKSLENCQKDISNYFITNQDINVVIESYLYHSEEVYSKCLETVKSLWFSQKSLERDTLNIAIDTAKTKVSQLQTETLSLLKKKQDLSRQIDTLDTNLEVLLKQQQQLKIEIAQELKDFESNIVKQISTSALFKTLNSTFSYKNDATKASSNIIINNAQNPTLLSTPDVLDSLEVLLEDLSDNFQAIGIQSEYSFEVAQALIATLYTHMGIVVPAYFARNFANAASAVIEASSSQVITLPSGYNDLLELTKLIKESTAKVILIENALDSLTENLCVSLVRDCTDKVLIFALNDSENISILNRGFWNFLRYFNLEEIINYPKQDELLYSKFSICDFEVIISEKAISSVAKDVSILCRDLNISKIHRLRYAEIMCICHEYFNASNINTILLLELIALCSQSEKEDILSINLSPLLEDRQQQLLHTLMKGA